LTTSDASGAVRTQQFQRAALLHRETDKDRFKKQLITDHPPQDGNLYFQRSGNVSQESLFPQLLTSFCLVNPSGHQRHGMKAAAEENALGNRLGKLRVHRISRADRARGEIG
jgi:hypothetical protein